MQARPLYGPDQPKTTVTELAHEFRRVVRAHFFDGTNFPDNDEDGTPHPSYIRYAREQQAKLRDVDAKYMEDRASNI
jgi:phage-related protein